MREFYKLTYYSFNPTASADEFDKAWPFLWKLRVPEELSKRTTKIIAAVVDSGIMHDHPLLKGCIVGEADWTGEGYEDLDGHGTAVALMIQMPYFRPTNMLNLRVIGRERKAPRINLVQALNWLVDYKSQHDVYLTANLSVGVYTRKWTIFDCRGDCEVCKAAMRAADHEIMLSTVVGNIKGLVACPASAGVYKKHPGILVNSGPGYTVPSSDTIMWPAQLPPLAPI
jgi:hypothetical protein